MNDLTHYDQMRQHLMQAHRIDEVKDIRDKAEALRQYARQAGESLENQNAVAEIKLRAERRAGELLKEMERGRPNPDGLGRYQREVPAQAGPELQSEYQQALTDASIAKSTANRWQQVAELPEEVFEQHIAETKAGGQELTSADMVRKAKSYRRKVKTEERLQEVKLAPVQGVQLFHGDFRKITEKLPKNSVDLILTDPPYPVEFLPLWEDMARAAVRLLAPGGYLVAYSGQRFLPDIYQMLGNHLEYQWTAAVRHSAGYHKIWMHDLLNAWKPILIYSKGKPAHNMRGLQDLITGGMGDKDAHDWAQPEAEAANLINYLSLPGQTILDPFMGSGTVVRAAHKMKRMAVGIEIDSTHFRNAEMSIYGNA